MRTVKSIIGDREIYFAKKGQTVIDVLKYMGEKNVGAVAVVDDKMKIVGVFSERDFVKRVVLKDKDPKSTKVDAVMTKDPVVGIVSESYESCIDKLQEVNVRHLPIVEDDKLIGMVSMRDLLFTNIQDKDEEIRHMNAYIHDTHL